MALIVESRKSSDDYQQKFLIYEKYANHLYSHQNYDSAIYYYILTIGHLQPSYVVKKVGLI